MGYHSVVGHWWRGRLARQHRHEPRRQSGHLPEYRRRHRRRVARRLADQPDGRRAVPSTPVTSASAGLLVSFLGAVVLLAIVNLITRKRVR